MAASIIRLEQELDEANARIAVLEEEQKILAKANAAVIEGGTGYSGAERPEPSPHFKSALDRLATVASEAFGPFPVQTAEENLTAIEAGIHGMRMDNDRLERERDEARAALKRIADCDWVITLPDRMDAVRKIARDALEAAK